MENTVSVNKVIKLIIPKTPNFIFYESDKKISIAELTDENLEDIGKVWTRQLVEHAKKLRNQPLLRSENES